MLAIGRPFKEDSAFIVLADLSIAWLDGNLVPATHVTRLASKWTLTPTLGADLLINGNMETGSPPSNWTTGSATLTRETTIIHGGAASAKIVSNAGADGGIYQILATGANKWCYAKGWFYAPGAIPTAYLDDPATGTDWTIPVVSSGTWKQIKGTGRNTAANTGAYFRSVAQGTPQTYYIDDASFQLITESSLFAVTPINTPLSYVQASVWDIANMQTGITLFKDANNWITTYITGAPNSVAIFKKVSGTVSAVLSSAAITYSPGALLRITPNGTFDQFTVAYNGVNKLSAVVIADFAPPSGQWYAGLYSTHDDGLQGCAFRSFSVVSL